MKSEWSEESKDMTHLYIYNQLKRMDKINERKWKYVSIFGAVCLGFTIILLAYTINLPKTVPLIISVNDFGEAKYVGSVNKLSYSGMKVPQIAIEYQIRKFVTNKYSLSTDIAVCRSNINDVYASLSSEAESKYASELKEVNPLLDVGKIIKTVDIESILKLTSNSYQIDFYLIQVDSRHQHRTSTHIRGIVHIEMLIPEKEEQIRNPLGIYIKNYEFTEIKGKNND